jgi:hypothetical protein
MTNFFIVFLLLLCRLFYEPDGSGGIAVGGDVILL